LDGCFFTNHYSPFDTDPKVQKFVNDYKARYNTVPDALAATAYDAAKIMFDAIKRANSLEGTAIRDALSATKEFPGVTGNVTFNENRDAVKPIVMIEIKPGGTYAVRERVQVEGAAMPSSATTTSSPMMSPGMSPAMSPGMSPAMASSPMAPATVASPKPSSSPY
jgi:hypothetical protein